MELQYIWLFQKELHWELLHTGDQISSIFSIFVTSIQSFYNDLNAWRKKKKKESFEKKHIITPHVIYVWKNLRNFIITTNKLDGDFLGNILSVSVGRNANL